MPTIFNSLPRELVDSILKLVPDHYLPSISLVCRTWHQICFPLLYHTVGLVDEDHAEAFIQRVLDESGNNEGAQAQGGGEKQNAEGKRGLRIASCVRRLHINLSLEGDPERLANLGRAVSMMKKVKHLHWDTVHLEELDWHSTLVLLHESLPELRSLNLVLPNVEFLSEDSDKVVALTNLQELSIKFDDSAYDDFADQDTPTETADLIRGASNLESLSLRFRYDDELSRNSRWAVGLFSALADARFPNLRSLRSRCTDFAPIDFYDRSVLRQFIQNHNQLHTVVLDTDGLATGADELDPELATITPKEMVELFPSVQHFEGPCVMVDALLRSKLVEQIETLGVIESSSDKLAWLSDLLPVLDYVTAFLPRLKVLKINSSSETWEDTLAGLVRFALKMPVLEELVIGESMRGGCNPSILDQCLETMKSLPHLRTLGIPWLRYSVLEADKSKDSKTFFLDAAAICPQLGLVKYIWRDELVGRWDIVRRLGEPIDVVCLYRPGFKPPDWSDVVPCAELFPPRW